jgi:1,4-alpha-glucan branching enzyme
MFTFKIQRILFLLLVSILCSISSSAQLLSVNEPFPWDTSSVTITVDCSKGNMGLMNYASVNDVYVHTGVITNLSTGAGNWRYVKFNQDFNRPNPALAATHLGNNRYSFTIPGIRNYFGVPAGEKIEKIALLFRSGNGAAVQRNSDASNMYVQVYDNAFAARFLQPLSEPRFEPVPEPVDKNAGDPLAIHYISNKPADLTLFYNGAPIATSMAATSVQFTQPIPNSGAQEIVGRAVNNGVTRSDTFRFFIAPPVNVLPLPDGAREGINYLPGDTSVILVLFAPGKNRALATGDFNNWAQLPSFQMNKTPDGNYFWTRLNGLVPGTEYAYQYIVDNQKIADYYTGKILDPSNDPEIIQAGTYPNLRAYPAGKTTGIVSVLQTRAPAYNWKMPNFQRPDKRNLVIYELFIRDFIAKHDYRTLIDTLNYLKNLGINAIELLPVNEFEGNSSWGYNTSFYFAPDKYYGSANTLKEFIDSCHSKGIAVIMDLVLNHSYGQSPMVQLYFDGANNRPASNSPWFNAITPHAAIGFGYDFNHESAATRYFVNRVTEHWLREYKMDGFRLDFTKGFTQKLTTTVEQMSALDTGRIEILKRINQSIQGTSAGAYVILEHLCENEEEKRLAAEGMLLWGNMNGNFNEATMGYNSDNKSNFSWAFHSARGFAQPHLVSYMESHDDERLMYKNLAFGNSAGPAHNVKNLPVALARTELATAFYLMIPGPKMIWQFGELGYDRSIFMCKNGLVPQPYPKDSCKLDEKPPVWNYLSDPGRKKIYDMISSLTKLRREYPAVFTGGNVSYDVSGAFKKIQLTDPSISIVIIGNFDIQPGNGAVAFPLAGNWYDYFTNEMINATGNSQNIFLQPGEYKIYVSKSLVTGVGDVYGGVNDFKATFYPNPVSSNSIVKYTLPATGNTSVMLMNSFGQQLSTLQRGTLARGDYQLSLNEFPVGYNALGSGVYILKIQSGNRNVYLRFLVLR